LRPGIFKFFHGLQPPGVILIKRDCYHLKPAVLIGGIYFFQSA
jgi:hypothetical protein